MKRKFFLLIFIFSLFKVLPSQSAQVIEVNRDYRIVAIDLGWKDGHLVPGIKLSVLSPRGVVKGIIELRRVGKYASAGNILQEDLKIQVGDKVQAFENTFIPKLKALPAEKKFLLTENSFLSFLQGHPRIMAIQHKRELFLDEAKKTYLKFFPSLEFWKLRGHLLQEGRRVEKYRILDVIPEWGRLYFQIPFEEIARRNYFLALVGKLEIELEKQKAELTLQLLRHLNLYLFNLEKARALNEELESLTRELTLLKAKKGLYPYLIQRVSAKISEKRKLLEIQKNKLQELKFKIALFLNLAPESKIIIPNPEKLYLQIKALLEVPEYGYNYWLAQEELKLKKAEYILSKLKIRPSFQYYLAYPSYVSSFKLNIPIKGKALIKASQIEQAQANQLLQKEQLLSKYKIKRLNTQLYYLKKLLSRYEDFKLQLKKLKPSYWQDRLDQEEKLSELEEKIQDLQAKIEQVKLELLNYGNIEVEPDIWLNKKLPFLEDSLKYLEENSPELKYLQLEAQKSFEYLQEAQAEHNQAKVTFFKDEYIYKLSLKKLRNQELKTQLINAYIEIILSNLDYQNSFQLAKIYRREWELKKKDLSLREYLVQSAKFAWQEELIKQIEKKMKVDLAYLDLKYLLSQPEQLPVPAELEINQPALEQLEREISKLAFDPNLRERIEHFKVLLATDQVEVAKRGYFITGPWEVVFTPRKLPSHGRRGSDWKRIGKGVEFLDWLQLYIPSGIIYRTPFGNRIHDIRIAQINLEISQIKSRQALSQEEHLRNLLLERFNFRKDNLAQSQQLLKEVKLKYLQLKSKLPTYQVEEEDVLAAERTYLDKKMDYLNKLKLYLQSKLDLLARGYPRQIATSAPQPLPKILSQIPKLKITQKEIEIVKEKYKKAFKLNFKDFLVIASGRLGLWFLLQLAPDINLIRASHIAKETPLWLEKANLDAEMEYQDWLSRIEIAQAKIEFQELLLEKINSFLKEIQDEISLNIAPYSHYLELKILEDRIRNEIQSQKDKMLYALMKLKTLLGLPPEKELLIPKLKIPELNPSELSQPELLLNVIAQESPDVKLKKSALLLAYKEKKWDAFLRNLKFSIDYFADVIYSRSYAWNISFAVFDLYLHQLARYYEDKIQYQNLLLGLERLRLKKDILLNYQQAQNYHLRTKAYREILAEYLKLIESCWQAYLRKEIPWESEYGILKILNQTVKFQQEYIESLSEFLYNFNRYQELEKNFLSPEKLKLTGQDIPLGFLTLENLKLRRIFSQMRELLVFLRNKLSLFKNYQRERLKYYKNIEYWNQKQEKRNFNLYVYALDKAHQKEELEKISQLYAQAEQIEYNSFLALEELWAKDYQEYLKLKQRIEYLLSPPYEVEYKEQIKKTLLLLKPKLYSEQSLFTPFEQEDLYNGLTNYFLKYLRNFRFSEKEIELFFNYLPQIASSWNQLKAGRKIELPSWWAKYTAGLGYLFILPYLEPNDINELGLIAHYALVAVYQQTQISPALKSSSGEILQKLNLRLNSEAKFLLLNLRNIPESLLSEFLHWQGYIIKEIDRISFQKFSYQEMESLRKELANLKVPFWEYLEGDKLEEQIQSDIIRWLIATSLNKKEKVFQLLQALPQILYQVYKPPSLEEISYSYQEVRLRYLLKQGNLNLTRAEYLRARRSYMIGLLLFWINKLLVEKISLPELKGIISQMQKIRNLPQFSSLYGRHSLTDERYLFYQHSLIYYAQRYRSPALLPELEAKFQWMNFLKNQPSFIQLYSRIDLSSEYLYQRYSIYQLSHYIGSLSFWANWAYRNKFSRETVIDFFQLYSVSLNSSKFRNHLETLYRKIGIDISLDLRQPSYEMAEEVKGLISNWVLYFYLRGIQSRDEIFSSLDEILQIAQLARKNQLNYTQDDLRYWFQHKNEQGYQIKDLEQIFSLMANLKSLLRRAVEEIYLSPELKEIIPRLKPYLKEIQNKKMHPGEIQRLAEEIIYPQKITLQELVEEYKIGILIQALYLSELDIQLAPFEVDRIFNFLKKEGLGIEDLLNLVTIMKKIYSGLRQTGFEDIFSEPELRKFIWEVNYQKGWNFAQRYFESWLPKLSFFLNQFQKEHNYLPPQRLIYSFLDYQKIFAPNWQIKRAIAQGYLSQEAEDFSLINLGSELNLKRELLYFAYTKFSLGLDIYQLDSYLNYLKDFSLHKLNQLLAREKEFEENLSPLLFAQSQDYFLEKLPRVIKLSLPMLSYAFLNQEKFKARIQGFAQRAKDGFQELLPNKKIQELLQSPSERIKLIAQIRNKAREKYNLILSPARTYALLWKLREGYSLQDCLKVFIELHQKLKDIYQKTFSQEIDGPMNNLLLHLAQQIHLTPLELSDINEIFLILRQLEKIYQLKRVKFPQVKAYRDAETIYFSGLTSQALEVIYQFLNKTKKYFPAQHLQNLLYICLKSFNSQLYHIPPMKLYSYQEYQQALLPTGISAQKLIPLLSRRNITPLSLSYFYLSAKKYSQELHLSSVLKKSLLGLILYQKTREPESVKAIMDFRTDAMVFAYLRRINLLVSKHSREIIRKRMLQECRY